MKDKIYKAFVQVNANRGEIEDIVPSGNEYYFKFRNRSFSVLQGTLYVYPKFLGASANLAGALEEGVEHSDLVALAVSDGETGTTEISKFYDWMQSKFMGLDDFLKDIGL